MSGRGADYEKNRPRIENLQFSGIPESLENTEDAVSRPQFTDSTSNIPQKIEGIAKEKNDSETETFTSILRDSEKRRGLEVEYEILFEGEGYRVLDAVAGEEAIRELSNSSHLIERTVPLMTTQGMIEDYGNRLELTDKGEDLHTNWSNFQNYLSSRERIDSIDSEQKDSETAAFLDAHLGRSVDLDCFLRKEDDLKNAWTRDYDPEAELYEIASVLYTDSVEDLGENLARLEQIGNDSISDESMDEYREKGIRGLVDTDGLNEDGQRLYSTVINDYMNIDR